MSTSKLPARPSLESLRKQAKKLARDSAAGEPGSMSRVRTQLPEAKLPLSQRNAQLVLAREYGFAGWQDLVKEVEQRVGRGLEWAVSEARRIIHDDDTESLRKLLEEHPALLSWMSGEEDGGLLGMATASYGDSFDPSREQQFTRAASAEFLIDAGAFVAPAVCDRLIESRARGLLHLFRRRGLLPPTLQFFAALGDLDGIGVCFAKSGENPGAASQAFLCACRFQHAAAAARLLDRCITLDVELGKRVDGGPGRAEFIQYIMAESEALSFTNADPSGPWQAFVMHQVVRAVNEGDLPAFVSGLRREAWMLSDGYIQFQAGLIERAVLRDREAFITALLDLNPAVLRSRMPPSSQALEFAFTYAKTHLLPALLRIWPMPDDLPHAAGDGDLERVKRWFDAAGDPALGDLANHFPIRNARYCSDFVIRFGERPGGQQVLDTALAWAVMNNHFEIADFLLAHGADINTNWSSHEPASMLHELVFHNNYQAMQFLIDRGIDLTMVDYRWRATAQGWAYHAAKDEKMAQWLREAQQRQENSLR